MIEVELSIPSRAKPVSFPTRIEQAATACSLTLTLKGTLAQYPGCVHWHYKKGKEPGTLEITWWSQGKRVWLKVAANRRATWMDETIPRLKQSIESKL